MPKSIESTVEEKAKGISSLAFLTLSSRFPHAFLTERLYFYFIKSFFVNGVFSCDFACWLATDLHRSKGLIYLLLTGNAYFIVKQNSAVNY